MGIRALRILCDIELPDRTIRIWDGAGGSFIDEAGHIYRPAQFTEDAINSIEASINGQAFTLSLSLVSVTSSVADSIWAYDSTVPVQGSPFVIKLQILGDLDQPNGNPIVVFSGTIDNLDVSDEASAAGIASRVNVEVVNRFTLRTLTNGAVLSDVDQKARSAQLNPAGNPDRFCERVPIYRDKTIRWPNW